MWSSSMILALGVYELASGPGFNSLLGPNFFFIFILSNMLCALLLTIITKCQVHSFDCIIYYYAKVYSTRFGLHGRVYFSFLSSFAPPKFLIKQQLHSFISLSPSNRHCLYNIHRRHHHQHLHYSHGLLQSWVFFQINHTPRLPKQLSA